MADIELVIKIPEGKYQGIINRAEEILDASTFCSPRYLYKAVLDGTPLPKGHGRLKDIDKIISDGISKGFCEWYDEMKYADTIVEADKESESKK